LFTYASANGYYSLSLLQYTYNNNHLFLTQWQNALGNIPKIAYPILLIDKVSFSNRFKIKYKDSWLKINTYIYVTNNFGRIFIFRDAFELLSYRFFIWQWISLFSSLYHKKHQTFADILRISYADIFRI